MNKEEILNLAELSRLNLSEEEISKFPEQFQSILDFVNQIKSAEISQEQQRDFSIKNVMREDKDKVHDAGYNKNEIMEEMPDVKDSYLKVKKILNN